MSKKVVNSEVDYENDSAENSSCSYDSDGKVRRILLITMMIYKQMEYVAAMKTIRVFSKCSPIFFQMYLYFLMLHPAGRLV